MSYNTKPIPLEHRKELIQIIKDNSDPIDCGYSTMCWVWKNAIDKHGYPRLGFKGQMYRAHRLAVAAFQNKQPGTLLACHKCDNKMCVNPAHLYIGSQQDNMKDKVARNRASSLRGEYNGRAKLTERDILHIFRLNAQKIPYCDIAKRYSVSNECVRSIIKRKIWKHVLIPSILLRIPITRKKRKSEDHQCAKLTNGQILKIFQLRASGYSCLEISKIYNINPGYVYKILRRESRKDVLIPGNIISNINLQQGKRNLK